MSKIQRTMSDLRLCRYPHIRLLSTGVRVPVRSLQRSYVGAPASMQEQRPGMPDVGSRHMRRAVLGQAAHGMVP